MELITQRFIKALQLAAQLHRLQMRKGTNIPYFSHLLAVCALVLEDGGDEDEAIAALLHDAVEDQGGEETLSVIHEQFGDRVAEIVRGCSDSFGVPKPPWKERKEAHLGHLCNTSSGVWRVSLADKLHNARTIVRELHTQGEAIWKKFNGGKEGTLWYYREFVAILKERYPSSLLDELERLIEQMEAGS